MAAGHSLLPGQVYAVVNASNSTSTPTSSVVASATSTPNTNNSSGPSSSTALAMYDLQHYFNILLNHSVNRIVLYAITGCVSALFCVVIVTGVSPV